MLRPAKILLVGTSAATVAFGAAASQPVITGQVQVGDIFAGQRLEVIDPADGVQLTTGAQGNSLDVERPGAFIRSRQSLDGTVRAESEAVIHGWSPDTGVTTAAVGNAVDLVSDGGENRTDTEQTIGSGLVTAWTGVTSVPSSSGDTSALSVAAGNNMQAEVDGEDANVDALQRHLGVGTKARVEAEIAHAMWSSHLTATAAGNQTAAQTRTGYTGVLADQVNTGATEASVLGVVYSGQTVTGLAGAMANAVDLSQQGWGLEARARQNNSGYVGARTDLIVGEFGEVSGTAIGTGNSVAAVVEAGEMLHLDTDQTNSGGVEVAATFDGGGGYDVSLSANALGNAVAANLCGDCDGELKATNNQVNSGDVSATASGHVGAARSVRSTAGAVGNSATYRVSRPN